MLLRLTQNVEEQAHIQRRSYVEHRSDFRERTWSLIDCRSLELKSIVIIRNLEHTSILTRDVCSKRTHYLLVIILSFHSNSGLSLKTYAIYSIQYFRDQMFARTCNLARFKSIEAFLTVSRHGLVVQRLTRNQTK